MNVYLILLVVLCNVICLRASRIMVSLFAIELGAPQYLIGVMIGLYALFPALLAVYAGRLSDRKGPHLPMLGGSAGAVAGMLIPFAVPTMPALAVSAAIPLLQCAEQVVIVSGGPENRAGPKSSHLAQYLANWDIRIERVRTKGRNVEKEIEDTYRDTESDLLVMGAYSRHRLRQLVFGGVTERMLFGTDLTTLMLHR